MVTNFAIEAIDRAVTRPVVALSSADPQRIEVLAHPAELSPITAAFVELGFLDGGRRLARFRGSSVDVVDLVPWWRWRLTDEHAEAIFADARILDGRRHFGRPAPHHALLIVAKLLSSADVVLSEEHRTWVAEALNEDPHAWARAYEQAPQWGNAAGLHTLENLGSGSIGEIQGRSTDPQLPRLRRGFTAPAVVALSGLDGAGKTTQGRLLKATLATLGIPALIEHRGLGTNPSVERVRATVRASLRMIGRAGPLTPMEQSSVIAPLLVTPGSPMPESRTARTVLAIWTTLIALNSSSSQRWFALRRARGAVVIFDRFALDSAVRLRYLYGESKSFRLQKWLIRTISPTPLRAFLLAVRPSTARGRKTEVWTLDDLQRHERLYEEEAPRSGVRILDGERPLEDLAAEIACEVWTTWVARSSTRRRFM